MNTDRAGKALPLAETTADTTPACEKAAHPQDCLSATYTHGEQHLAEATLVNNNNK